MSSCVNETKSSDYQKTKITHAENRPKTEVEVWRYGGSNGVNPQCLFLSEVLAIKFAKRRCVPVWWASCTVGLLQVISLYSCLLGPLPLSLCIFVCTDEL